MPVSQREHSLCFASTTDRLKICLPTSATFLRDTQLLLTFIMQETLRS